MQFDTLVILKALGKLVWFSVWSKKAKSRGKRNSRFMRTMMAHGASWQYMALGHNKYNKSVGNKLSKSNLDAKLFK